MSDKMLNIKEVITRSEYKFLYEDEHLKNKLLFLTFGGSHAYGTNVETSDVDVRGVTMNSINDLLGMGNFEQFINEPTDTVVYSFNKIIKLLINCNPNVCETLGCHPDTYVFFHPIGKELVNNKKMFLSKRAAYSFGGYAKQQLNRLENALARDRLSQVQKEEHILNSCEVAMMNFHNKYKNFKEGSIYLYMDDSDKKDFEQEIFMDITLNHYPLRDYKSIWSDLNNIVKDYGSLNHRNNKKDDAHLNKHAQHLVRLYLMAFDILERGELQTYREKDRKELLEIRNGKYMKDDGTYYPEFFELIRNYEKRLEYAKNNTSLPDSPNMEEVENFVYSCNMRFINYQSGGY